MAFTNSVLLVVTLVRPVPQFSSSGTLMSITANENATLGEPDLLDTKVRVSRRQVMKRGDEDEYLRNVEEGDKEEGSWYIGDEGDQKAKSEKKETSKAEESPTAEGEGDETTEDSESEGSILIYSTASPKKSDDKLSKPHHTKVAAEIDEDEYWVPGLDPGAIYSKGQEDEVKSSSTTVTSTATVQIIEEVIAAQQATGTVISRVRSPNVYIEAWIGPLGVCIQRG